MNIMDITIIDIDKNQYDINSIHASGNDTVVLVIKNPTDNYIPRKECEEQLKKWSML